MVFTKKEFLYAHVLALMVLYFSWLKGKKTLVDHNYIIFFRVHYIMDKETTSKSLTWKTPLMLGYGRRQWASDKPTLAQRLVFAVSLGLQ